MTATIRAASDAATEIATSLGQPRHSRRLSDKILGAFNHAYAIGAVGTAARLRDILKESEGAPAGGERRNRDALAQADRWTAFVDARNAYQKVAGRRGAESESQQAALQDMRAAYLRWKEV